MQDYITHNLKQNDYFRYMASLFAPQAHRPHLQILLLLYQEIGKICSITPEPMVARIRLQWWREAIDNAYNNKGLADHPILPALRELIQSYNIDYALFESLVDAFETELDALPVKNVDALDTYFSKQNTPFADLCCAVLGVSGPDSLLHMAVAWSYMNMLRSLTQKTKGSIVFIDEISAPEITLIVSKMEWHLMRCKPEPNAYAFLALSHVIKSYISALRKAKLDINKVDITEYKLRIVFRMFVSGIFAKH